MMRQSSKQCSSQAIPLLPTGSFKEILQSDLSFKSTAYPFWIVCPKGNLREELPRL